MNEPLPKIEPNLLGCNWQEYKKMAVEFHQMAPDLDYDELDNAFKCLTLAYFNLKCDPMWKGSSVIVMEMATKDFMQREMELMAAERKSA